MTSDHFTVRFGRTLNIKGNIAVTAIKETTKSTDRTTPGDKAATERMYPAGIERRTSVLSETKRKSPKPSMSAKETSLSFIAFNTVRPELHAESSGTFQMVFSASLSSLMTAAAPKNKVPMPSSTAVKLWE